MNYSENLEKPLELLTKNLQDCWESQRQLQLHALSLPEQYRSSLTQQAESILDIASSISAELEEIRKTLLLNS